MARSSEPLWWLPFSAGMMIDAMLIPALVIITGVLLPLGVLSEETLDMALGNIIGRGAVFAVAALSFFHAAHRLRFTLIDLGLKPIKMVVALAMYGGAIAGTLAAAAALFGSSDVCASFLSLCSGR